MRSRYALALLLVACALGAPLHSQSRPAYVHASRVALRSQPASTAAAITFLTTNAEVQAIDKAAGWCRVQSGQFHGFIACALLGDAPLTMAAVRGQLSAPNLSPRETLDWSLRAFWIAPSLWNFATLGEPMEQALLAGSGREREMVEGKVLRRPNPEFEAIKERLARGVIAPRQLRSWSTIEHLEPLATAMKREPLSAVRRSYFAGNDMTLGLALRPFKVEDADVAPLTDALSAEHGVPFQVRVLSAAYMAHFGVVGVWDVAGVGITFDRPVVLHGVTARGTPTGLNIRSFNATLGYAGCTEGGMLVKGTPVNSRWSSAIVAWVGKAPPSARITVTSSAAGGPGPYDKLVIETIDLDNDAVPDFSIWAGIAPPVVGYETYWKAVFANLNGEWVLVAFRQEPDCT